MNKQHISVRMCIACRNMKPKTELIRIVKYLDADSKHYIHVDENGKMPGRGAYICKNMDCFNLARKAKKLQKHFSCAISDKIYEEIENKIICLEEECNL